jgi:two-component system, OmpR family, response regulator VicR
MNASRTARILVVDDDKYVTDNVRSYLEQVGYVVDTAYDGRGALERSADFCPDLVVLDGHLPRPGPSGWNVCAELRRKYDLAIIMLTREIDEGIQANTLRGECRADDYVTKPYSDNILSARIEAVLRRYPLSQRRLASHDRRICLDPISRQVWIDGLMRRLGDKDFEVLHTLMLFGDEFVPVTELLKRVWGDAELATGRLRESIRRLRQELEDDPKSYCYIENKADEGYRFIGRVGTFQCIPRT